VPIVKTDSAPCLITALPGKVNLPSFRLGGSPWHKLTTLGTQRSRVFALLAGYESDH
jgi:hypothetical protein